MRWLLVAAALACGGTKHVEASGQVGGEDAPLVDALAVIQHDDPTVSAGVTHVWLSSHEDFCEIAVNYKGLAGSQLLAIELGIVLPSSEIAPATVTGTYRLVPASVEFGTQVAAARINFLRVCSVRAHADAIEGTVEVTHLTMAPDGTVQDLAGSYDLTFETGHLQGRFRAPGCPLTIQLNLCN